MDGHSCVLPYGVAYKVDALGMDYAPCGGIMAYGLSDTGKTFAPLVTGLKGLTSG